MILIGKPKARKHVNPIDEVHSNYRAAKTMMGDMCLCSCTFPHQPMSKGFFGWTCNNTRCRDFISFKDTRFIERVKLDTESVMRFANRRHSSSLLNRIKRAANDGNYVQAFGRR
jgi:hypothetical protein